MIPKLVFLGTAGDPYIFSKNARAGSGIVITLDSNQLIIDPASGSVANIAKLGLNIRETTGVLISTTDTIFSGDVNSVVSAMTFDGIDSHGVLIGTRKALEGNDKEIPLILNKTKKSLEKHIIIDNEQRIAINNIEIQSNHGFIRTENSTTEHQDNLIYKINFNDVIIGYISNTAYSENISRFLKGCSIIITSFIDLDEYSRPDSLNFNDIVKIISEVEPSLGIITDFGIKVIKNDPIAIAREIYKKTNVQIVCASDGLNITPTNYSRKTKQTNLGNFKQ